MSDPMIKGNKCKCCACFEYFRSVSVFDAHRRGTYPNRKCMTVDEMEAKRWMKSKTGHWMRAARSTNWHFVRDLSKTLVVQGP